MEMILSEIFRAIGYLFIAGIVFFAWNTARENAEGGKYKTVLWKGFLWCVGIAFFLSLMLGNPSCVDREYDAQGSFCNEYADDGYEPTTEQKAANFAYYMTLLYIPVVFGALNEK